MSKCDRFSITFPISPPETTPFSKITILIFLNFHFSSNLMSNPQATLILFPSIIEMFPFRTVINMGNFIFLVLGNKMSDPLSKLFFKSVFIVLSQYFYCHYFSWHLKFGASYYQCCYYYYYKYYYL